jgi:hypothetical protein
VRVADNEWKIAKPGAACCSCQAPLGMGQTYFSALLHGEAVQPAPAVDAIPDSDQAGEAAKTQHPTGSAAAAAQVVDELLRRDFCATCFQEKRPEGVYYFWKATQQAPDDNNKRRQPVIDVDYIIEFFKRLEGDPAPQRIAFRYILALMLTRKKVLYFEEKKKDSSGNELQIFREKRGGQAHQVYEPSLSEDEITAVSAELGVLLGLTPAPAAAAASETPAAEGTPAAEINQAVEEVTGTDQERRTAE